MDVKDFIDLHLHIGPEPIPRKFTLPELIRKESGRIGGFALKNHFYPTTPMIGTAGAQDGLELTGSIVLNNYVGGLNPDAITGAARISERPIIVWFPTINAQNFLSKSRYEIRPEWTGGKFRSRLSRDVKGIRVTDASGKLTGAARAALRAVKDNGCVLATGHLSSEESQRLVSEAIGMGIGRIIITHPIYQLIGMPIEVQKEMTGAKGVYAEIPYSMYAIDGIGMDRIARDIRGVGPEKCIISSDVGQINMPGPSAALREFADLLKGSGIGDDDIRTMGSSNPRRLAR